MGCVVCASSTKKNKMRQRHDQKACLLDADSHASLSLCVWPVCPQAQGTTTLSRTKFVPPAAHADNLIIVTLCSFCLSPPPALPPFPPDRPTHKRAGIALGPSFVTYSPETHGSATGPLRQQ